MFKKYSKNDAAKKSRRSALLQDCWYYRCWESITTLKK